MFEDDDRRLVQIASIANAVARAGEAQPWRALIWLAEQVEAGALAARLCIPVSTSRVDRAKLPEDESKIVWRSLAKRAKAERDKDMLDYYLPPASSTWHVHVSDLMQFASSAPIPAAVVEELNKLAEIYRGTLPFPVRPLRQAGSPPPVSTGLAISGARAAWTPQRRSELLKEFRALGGKRRTETGAEGKRGALMELARKSGVDKDSLADQLDKAIEEKRAADMWTQLNTAK